MSTTLKFSTVLLLGPPVGPRPTPWECRNMLLIIISKMFLRAGHVQTEHYYLIVRVFFSSTTHIRFGAEMDEDPKFPTPINGRKKKVPSVRE